MPPAGDVLGREPADRAVLAVDDQEMAQRVGERPAPGVGRVVSRARRRDGVDRELADAVQREPLEAAIGAHEPGHELRGRVTQDLGRRAELGDPAAVLHDHDQVAHLDRLVDVVGHEQDRLGERLLQAQELVLEALPDDGIDRPERLVHQHHGRVGRQGPRDPDALALAARELRREAPGDTSPDRAPRSRAAPPRDSAASARASRAGGSRSRRSPRSTEVREQPDLLDDVPDAAPELRDVPRGRVDAVEQDPAGGRLDQPVHHLERGRLAAAGRPDEHADPARGHLARVRSLTAPAAPVRRRGRVVVLGDVVELDRGGRGASRAVMQPPVAVR